MTMTKDEYLALAASRYDELQRLNTEQTDFYHYEEAFVQLWTGLGREVLENNLGDVPVSPRKKRVASVVLGALK